MELDEDSTAKIVKNWIWLIGTDKTPILISAIGDMFLVDTCKRIYWLDLDIVEHFGYLGHVYGQIKDLPDGTGERVDLDKK